MLSKIIITIIILCNHCKLSRITSTTTHLNQDLVFLIRQSVEEHPQAFIPPHSDERPHSREAIGRGLQQTLRNPGQIAQVEDVVELGRGRREVVDDDLVEVEGPLGDLVGDLLDVLVEGLGVAGQDGGVDVLEGGVRREGDVEGAEEGDEAGVDLVTTSASLGSGKWDE